MEPHAQALPQNRVHHPQKNKHDYPKNPKTGIEITRRAVDLPGFVQRRTKLWERSIKTRFGCCPEGCIGWCGVTGVYTATQRTRSKPALSTKEQQAAREEGELCRFVRMAPDGGVELISNAGAVVRFKNTGDLVKTLRFAKDALRITEVLKKWESGLN